LTPEKYAPLGTVRHKLWQREEKRNDGVIYGKKMHRRVMVIMVFREKQEKENGVEKKKRLEQKSADN